MLKNTSLLIILFVALLFSSCRKSETSWDTNWIAPIAYGTLDFNDLIQDSTFAVNPDSTLQLIFKTNIVDLDFDSIFQIPDTLIREKVALAIDLNVAPGTSFINQVDERQFDIENAQIKELRIENGFATVTLSNPIQTGIYITLTLPGVVKDGITLSLTKFVAAGTLANPTIISFEVDFTSYFMDLRGSSGNSWNTLQSIFEVQSDPAGSSVLVTTQDTIVIDVDFQNMQPDYGRGYFGNQVFAEIDTVNLDFMKNFVSGTFLLDQANMNLNIINGLKVTASGKVNQLTSINSNTANNIDLSHSIIGQNININPATGSWTTLTPFIFPININTSNSNINSFIENLPDLMLMDYEFELNPLGNISGGNDYFYPNSAFAVELELNMPTAFSASNLKFVDTLDLNFNQDTAKIKIQNGSLTVKADNYFPFDVSISLVFLDANDIPIDTLNSTGYLLAGIPDGQGKVNSPRYSEINFSVDQNFVTIMEYSSRVMVIGVLNNINHPVTYSLYDYYNIDLKITTNIGLLIQL